MEKIVFSAASVASIALMPSVNGFFLPGIQPKSYGLTEELPISMSAMMTHTAPVKYDFSNNKITTNRTPIDIPRETRTNYDFCEPDDGWQLESVSHSSTTGYFSSQIINSPYKVDM